MPINPIHRQIPPAMGTGKALCPSYVCAIDNLGNHLGTPMAMDYRRYYQPGGHYFFTVVTEQRQPLLIEHIDRLRTAFHHGMERYPFTIEAIVVLPDHLHTLWRLPDGDALGQKVQFYKADLAALVAELQRRNPVPDAGDQIALVQGVWLSLWSTIPF